VLSALVIVVPFFAAEPIRSMAERQMNACVKGYTAHIGAVDVRPLSLAVHVRDLQIVQDASRDPPMVRIRRISTDVRLGAMLRGRIIAKVLVDEAHVDTNRAQVLRELETPIALLKDCALVRALRVVYAIELFRVSNGSVSYVDRAEARPLTLRELNMKVHNIRIVRSGADVQPSPLTVGGVVFDEGRFSVDGSADLLREPHAAFKGRVAIARIPLDHLSPLTAPYGLTIAHGTLEGVGNVEYSPDVALLDLEHVEVDRLQGDYAFRKPAAGPAKEAAKAAAVKAHEVSAAPNVVLRARRVRVQQATLGFVNEGVQPRYRIFVDDMNLHMENFANHLTEGTGAARLTGRLMGSGETVVTATLRPETNGPDFDLSARIEEMDLRQLNDVLRAHAQIDLASGLFSMYSEMHVKDGRVEGYVKPLLRGLKAYDPAQDQEKSIGQKIKEKAVNIAGKLLRNRPRSEVATVVPITGPLENPKANTWETIITLLQNAFFKAILPGFIEEARGASRR
jgi:hypothetical protein